MATASFGYVRLHRGTADTRPTGDGDRALAGWDERLHEVFGDGRDVFVYFNDDRGGAAVHDARRLVERSRRTTTTSTTGSRS